jgi:hypothetical protein
MNSISPDSRSTELEPVKPAGMDALLWDEATAEQKLVLSRIAKQRARIKARAAAKAQALALRSTQLRMWTPMLPCPSACCLLCACIRWQRRQRVACSWFWDRAS